MNPHNGDVDTTWTHCHPGGRQLSDYLDGELAPQARAAIEAHVAACASCAEVLSELRLVTERAPSLALPAEPESDLWPGIQRRLSRPAPEMVAGRQGRWRATLRGRLVGRAALAVAAMLLLACAVTVVWLVSDPRTWRTSQEREGGPAAVAPVSVSGQQDEETLAALRRTVHGTLTDDPRVLDVIEENLAVIDVAIAEYREALANAPEDADLARRLEAARQRKLAVLRQAAELAPEGPE